MIIILAVLAGALFGAWRARRGGGSRLDMAQYAATHAVIFGLIGLAITVVLMRAMV